MPTSLTAWHDQCLTGDQSFRDRCENLGPLAREGPAEANGVKSPEIGRPIRTPSNTVETKEEQHEVRKAEFGDKNKQ